MATDVLRRQRRAEGCSLTQSSYPKKELGMQSLTSIGEHLHTTLKSSSCNDEHSVKSAPCSSSLLGAVGSLIVLKATNSALCLHSMRHV